MSSLISIWLCQGNSVDHRKTALKVTFSCCARPSQASCIGKPLNSLDGCAAIAVLNRTAKRNLPAHFLEH
jgi:hypothetical protein